MSDKAKKILGLVAAIGISAFVFIFRGRLVDLKGYGYLGIFLISVLGNATIILPVPVILTAFVGGGVYNPLLVGFITALGATIGEMTGYLAGLAGQVVVSKEKRLQKIDGWMHQY